MARLSLSSNQLARSSILSFTNEHLRKYFSSINKIIECIFSYQRFVHLEKFCNSSSQKELAMISRSKFYGASALLKLQAPPLLLVEGANSAGNLLRFLYQSAESKVGKFSSQSEVRELHLAQVQFSDNRLAALCLQLTTSACTVTSFMLFDC